MTTNATLESFRNMLIHSKIKEVEVGTLNGDLKMIMLHIENNANAHIKVDDNNNLEIYWTYNASN